MKKIKRIKLDRWGACDTPGVLESDSMSIKPRRENKNQVGNKSFYYDKLTQRRAEIILSRENSIRKVNNVFYLVRSQSGYGSYRVQWNGKEWSCNCPDYAKNGNIRLCKHIVALKLRLELGYVIIEGLEPKIEKKTYSQDWDTYNLAQSREIELFDKFLYQLVSTIEEPEKHGPGKPSMKLQDKVFCCIMKVYSQLSSRRSQCLYHQAIQKQQISYDPHFNIVSKTLNKNEIFPILHKLVHLSAQPLASVETDFAIDSSGFRCSTFGNYCEEKHSLKRTRNWLKVHICSGVSTNIVTDVIITDEHFADGPQLKKLVQNTADIFTIGEVSADLAYSSQKNLQIIDSFGGNPYIPFKKNATGKRGSGLWRKKYHYFQLHKEEFMDHYHKRVNVESTFAAIKKKFGESVKSKNWIAQENELLCKIIAYNITVLIHEMIKFGADSDFLSFDGLQKEQIIKQSNDFNM